MASPPSTEPKYEHRPQGYIEWSRDPAVGFFVVTPLWLAYEILRHVYVPDRMNLAEYWVKEQLFQLPKLVLDLYGICVGVAVVFAAWRLIERQIPWARVGMVVILEGSVYGLMLGPLASQLTRHSLPLLSVPAFPPDGSNLVADLIGSLGAGVFEELVFRMGLLSILGWCFMKVCQQYGLHRYWGVTVAVLASSLLFSLFHHVGPGAAPIEARVFVFRTIAGVILGVLFITRGLGVCVYTHAMYDVFFYLQSHP